MTSQIIINPVELPPKNYWGVAKLTLVWDSKQRCTICRELDLFISEQLNMKKHKSWYFCCRISRRHTYWKIFRDKKKALHLHKMKELKIGKKKKNERKDEHWTQREGKWYYKCLTWSYITNKLHHNLNDSHRQINQEAIASTK